MHSITSHLPLIVALALLGGCSKTAHETTVTEPTHGSNDAGELKDPTALKDPVHSQIDHGAALYGKHCADCHGAAGEGATAPMLVGEGALPRHPPATRKHRQGEFASVQDVFEFVGATMPPNAPGQLSDDDVWALLAFDLAANGVELSVPLDASTASDIALE